MLSIGNLGGGSKGEYYISLGREDYYLEGGEPPGKWLGRGAAELGLLGTVKAEDFRNILSGYSAAGEPLIQNAGETDHQQGWDLTFSAPKSVSVLWALSDEEERKAIQRAHDLAVEKSVAYIEDEFSFTRRGKGGSEREGTRIIVAAFQHGTSRAQDPQIHTHALVMNVGVREDGTTGTILSKPIYQAKMAGGAVYRAELSFQLEKLGYEIEREGDFFKIKGVSKVLCDKFSKRRAEIETELDRLGYEGARASAAATLATREVKGHTAREELFKQWQQVGKEFEFTKEEAKNLKRDEPIRKDERAETKAALDEALGKITIQQSHFSEKEIVRRTAEAAQGRGIAADDVRRGVKEEIAKSDELVYLGRIDGERRYTTKEMLEIETRMLSSVKGMMNGTARLKENVAIKHDLSLEQKEALFHITETDGKVKAVSGMAGTGKTTLLASAKKVWEASGYEVVGAALAGKAARGLQEGAGIKSTTLHKTLLEIERGNLAFNDKTILVIDEAGMVGTRQMAKVVEEVKRANAKLVLVGDEKQLQPIDAGAPFRAIGDVVGRVELKDIRRQRDQKDIEAIRHIVSGQSEKALASYAERGLLTVADDRGKAIDALVLLPVSSHAIGKYWEEGRSVRGKEGEDEERAGKPLQRVIAVFLALFVITSLVIIASFRKDYVVTTFQAYTVLGDARYNSLILGAFYLILQLIVFVIAVQKSLSIHEYAKIKGRKELQIAANRYKKAGDDLDKFNRKYGQAITRQNQIVARLANLDEEALERMELAYNRLKQIIGIYRTKIPHSVQKKLHLYFS